MMRMVALVYLGHVLPVGGGRFRLSGLCPGEGGCGRRDCVAA